MTKYTANPVSVTAHKIVSVGEPQPHGAIKHWKMNLALDNGENVVADAGMMARHIPEEGDYWVIQEDGYTYLNPKAVFERKYHRSET